MLIQDILGFLQSRIRLSNESEKLHAKVDTMKMKNIQLNEKKDTQDYYEVSVSLIKMRSIKKMIITLVQSVQTWY